MSEKWSAVDRQQPQCNPARRQDAALAHLFRLESFDRLRISAASAPVRQVVRRSHGGYVAQFPSTKSLLPVECESLLELDFARLAEVDVEVTGILHQPCEIIWIDDNHQKHRHIPDFAIQRGRSAFLVEVKPWAKAADPKVARRKAPIAAALAPYDIAYRVVTDRTIRAEPQLANAKVVLKGLKSQPFEHDRLAVLDVVASALNGISLESICEELGRSEAFCNCLLSMIITGDLKILWPRSEPLPAVSAIKVQCRSGGTP